MSCMTCMSYRVDLERVEAERDALRQELAAYKRLARGLDRIVAAHRMQFSPPNIGDIIDRVEAAREEIKQLEAAAGEEE